LKTVEIPARSEEMCSSVVSNGIREKLGIIEPKQELMDKYNILPSRILTKACGM